MGLLRQALGHRRGETSPSDNPLSGLQRRGVVRGPDGRVYEICGDPATGGGATGLRWVEPPEPPPSASSPRRVWAAEAERLRADLTPGRVQKRSPDDERSVTPSETLRRFRPLLPAAGITRLANVTGLDCVGIPVFVACRPNSRGLATTQGKGVDLDSARVSAMMEGLERFVAERVVLPLLFASADELLREVYTADLERLPRRGAMVSRHERLFWAPGLDLLGQTDAPVWVPYEVVHTDWSSPGQPRTGSFHHDANGLASGNHLLEAVVHGLCELIERDALALLTFGGEAAANSRRVDLSTIDDPVACELIGRFERAGVAVAVWDATSDVGLATFLALVADRDPLDPRQLYSARGSGCHPSRALALRRALTEGAQSRLSFIAGSRDDMTREEYESLCSPELASRTAEILSRPARRAFQMAPSASLPDVSDDLEMILDRLRAVDVRQVIAIDLRRPELPVPVVRVVAPGLEGDCEAGARPGPRAIRAALLGRLES